MKNELNISIKHIKGKTFQVLMLYDKNVPQHDIKKGVEHKRGTLCGRMQKRWHPIVYKDIRHVLLAAVNNLLLTV